MIGDNRMPFKTKNVLCIEKANTNYDDWCSSICRFFEKCAQKNQQISVYHLLWLFLWTHLLFCPSSPLTASFSVFIRSILANKARAKGELIKEWKWSTTPWGPSFLGRSHRETLRHTKDNTIYVMLGICAFIVVTKGKKMKRQVITKYTFYHLHSSRNNKSEREGVV